MRPFAPFFGGKWALARYYGPPQREQEVIEPFAGFAGYSTYWEPKRVTLVEKDSCIVGIWRYLQRASPREIMAIPTEIESVDDLRVCQEAKDLIGFWFDHGMRRPRGNATPDTLRKLGRKLVQIANKPKAPGARHATAHACAPSPTKPQRAEPQRAHQTLQKCLEDRRFRHHSSRTRAA